jgi:hypothetical protein
MEYWLLTFGLLGQFLFGGACAWILTRRASASFVQTSDYDQLTTVAEITDLGIVLGTGLTSFGQLVWSLCGGQLGRGPVLAVSLTGLLAVGILPFLHHRTRSRVSCDQRQSLTPGGRRWCRVCAVLVLLVFIVQASFTLMTPQRLWDERAHYASKATVLFHDQTVNSEELLHPDWVQGHPNYPLLLPLAEHNVYALLGRVDDRIAKLVPVFLFFGTVLAFAGVVGRSVGPPQGWLCAVLLSTVPVMAFDDYGALCVQADAPVGCFHGVSVLCLWDALRTVDISRRTMYGSLAAAGIAAGLARFTKDEAFVFFLVDLTALAFLVALPWFVSGLKLKSHSARRNEDGAFRQILGIVLFAGLALALIGPWAWHRSHLPEFEDMRYLDRLSWSRLVGEVRTLTWSIPHMIFRMFVEAPRWGIQWWVAAAAIVMRPRRLLDRPQMLLVIDFVGAIAAFLVAGMLAPMPYQEHLGNSSHRFLMQLTPVSILLIVGQWGMVSQPKPVDTAQSEMNHQT